MLREYLSRNLEVPYLRIRSNNNNYFLCKNGVLFSEQEYLNELHNKGDLQKAYEQRKMTHNIYDYEYAKQTGLLRKIIDRDEEIVPKEPAKEIEKKESKVSTSIQALCWALMFVSLGSMYISTLHTATYLYGYVDVVSSWIMSTVITVYCSTALEVVILFYERKRKALSCVFSVLWTLVTLFSMVTTVSVFYDRYNFTVIETAKENNKDEGKRLALKMLERKEEAIRQNISLKVADMEYRRTKDYATTAVRKELDNLQVDLQKNLGEQQKLLEESPDVIKKESDVHKKESLFVYLGRLMKIDGGILEFLVSTLSAIFINLISPFSVATVVSLLNKEEKE